MLFKLTYELDAIDELNSILSELEDQFKCDFLDYYIYPDLSIIVDTKINLINKLDCIIYKDFLISIAI